MSVSLIWSSTNGGAALTSVIDHGSAANGDTTTAQEVFLRHNGLNAITNVGLYIRAYSATYGGAATSAADLAELLAWGDASTSDAFGGFQVNFNATGSYPTANWPTVSSKSPTNGFVHRTGVGDSEGNAVSVTTATGASAVGEIQTGSAPNVRFQSRIVVPTDEDTSGLRQFDQVVRFSFTS